MESTMAKQYGRYIISWRVLVQLCLQLGYIWYQNQQKVVKEGLASYMKVLNRLLEVYATDSIMAETHNDVVRNMQLPDLFPLKWAIALWMRALHCLHIYNEYVLKKTFLEVLSH